MSRATLSSTELGRQNTKSWVDVQHRTFTQWTNLTLGTLGIKIDDLTGGFQNGVNLCRLVETLSKHKIPQVKATPKTRFDQLHNNGAALKFLQAQGIKLVAIGPEDMVDQKLKLILGLVWTIILHYRIAGGKSELLEWVRRTISARFSLTVNNFTTSFSDGIVLIALVEALAPGSYKGDVSALSKTDKYQNAETGIRLASEVLGVPKLMEPGDFADFDVPDELSVMTYIATIRDASLKAGNTGSGSAGASAQASTSSKSAPSSESSETAQAAVEGAIDLREELLAFARRGNFQYDIELQAGVKTISFRFQLSVSGVSSNDPRFIVYIIGFRAASGSSREEVFELKGRIREESSGNYVLEFNVTREDVIYLAQILFNGAVLRFNPFVARFGGAAIKGGSGIEGVGKSGSRPGSGVAGVGSGVGAASGSGSGSRPSSGISGVGSVAGAASGAGSGSGSGSRPSSGISGVGSGVGAASVGAQQNDPETNELVAFVRTKRSQPSAHYDGESPTPGQEVKIAVQLQDESGQPLRDAAASFRVVIVGLTEQDRVVSPKGIVEEDRAGQAYSVGFTPSVNGIYAIRVLFDGNPITPEPFLVRIGDSGSAQAGATSSSSGSGSKPGSRPGSGVGSSVTKGESATPTRTAEQLDQEAEQRVLDMLRRKVDEGEGSFFDSHTRPGEEVTILIPFGQQVQSGLARRFTIHIIGLDNKGNTVHEDSSIKETATGYSVAFSGRSAIYGVVFLLDGVDVREPYFARVGTQPIKSESRTRSRSGSLEKVAEPATSSKEASAPSQGSKAGSASQDSGANALKESGSEVATDAEAHTGELVALRIELQDEEGKGLTGGVSRFNVRLALLGGSDEQTAHIKPQVTEEDGGYSISFRPDREGTYVVHIEFDGNPVRPEPFVVRVRGQSSGSKSGSGVTTESSRSAQPASQSGAAASSAPAKSGSSASGAGATTSASSDGSFFVSRTKPSAQQEAELLSFLRRGGKREYDGISPRGQLVILNIQLQDENRAAVKNLASKFTVFVIGVNSTGSVYYVESTVRETNDGYSSEFTPDQDGLYAAIILLEGNAVRPDPFLILVGSQDASGSLSSSESSQGASAATYNAAPSSTSAAANSSAAREASKSAVAPSSPSQLRGVPATGGTGNESRKSKLQQYGRTKLTGAQAGKLALDAKTTIGQLVDLNVQLQDGSGEALRNGASRFGVTVLGFGDDQQTFEVAASVVEENDGYLVEFIPEKQGYYLALIEFDGNPVREDPFIVRVGTTAIDTTASDDGVEAQKVVDVGSEVVLEVGLAGEDGEDVIGAVRRNELTAVVRGPTLDKVPVVIEEVQSGKYRVQYLPQRAGLYELEVLYGGANILGKPFVVRVEEPRTGAFRIEGSRDAAEVLASQQHPEGSAAVSATSRDVELDDREREFADLKK